MAQEPALKPVTLVNVMKVAPDSQAALIALLKQNIDNVIRKLDGWRRTRLIAAGNGASVIIYSEWESPAAVEAMRSDPRMTAYLPQLLELAQFESVIGTTVFDAEPCGTFPQ